MEGNEIGLPLSRLQLDPVALSAVLDAAKDQNCTSVRLNGVPSGAVELPQSPSGYLCKKCRYTFPTEQLVSSHGCGTTPGCLALVRVRPGCRQCEQSFDTIIEYKRHSEQVHQQPTTTSTSTNTSSTSSGHSQTTSTSSQITVGNNNNNSSNSNADASTNATEQVPPLSPRLSIEMEDVVNQITALAAQSLKPDPNANIFPLPTQGQS